MSRPSQGAVTKAEADGATAPRTGRAEGWLPAAAPHLSHEGRIPEPGGGELSRGPSPRLLLIRAGELDTTGSVLIFGFVTRITL